jgi:hypothetical protein
MTAVPFGADGREALAGAGTPRTHAPLGLLADAHFASDLSIVSKITM